MTAVDEDLDMNDGAASSDSVDTVQRARRAFVAACTLDVMCFKPGNVSVRSPGRDLLAEDFIISAQAAVTPICDPSLSVGERILGAVQATREAVGTNTNLGIVLLAAPLMWAYCNRAPGQDLLAALQDTLSALSQRDASLAYEAIRLAAPAGLGVSQQHDVYAEPAVTLLEAMRHSAGRDSIARQYVTGYADIWDMGLPALRRGYARDGDTADAVMTVFLAFLAGFPDSHVWRKHGFARAEQVRREGAAQQAAYHSAPGDAGAWGQLVAFDGRLKASGINPGTSADLTVAVLIAGALQEDGSVPSEFEAGVPVL